MLVRLPVTSSQQSGSSTRSTSRSKTHTEDRPSVVGSGGRTTRRDAEDLVPDSPRKVEEVGTSRRAPSPRKDWSSELVQEGDVEEAGTSRRVPSPRKERSSELVREGDVEERAASPVTMGSLTSSQGGPSRFRNIPGRSPCPLHRITIPDYYNGSCYPVDVFEERIKGSRYPNGNEKAGDPSRLSMRRLKDFAEKYPFPRGTVLALPSSESIMTHYFGRWVPLSVNAFDAGLRFPLHPFIRSVLSVTSFSPTQVHPSVWRHMLSFIARCQDVGLNPNANLFHSMFNWKRVTQKEGLVTCQILVPPAYRMSSHESEWVKDWFLMLPPPDDESDYTLSTGAPPTFSAKWRDKFGVARAAYTTREEPYALKDFNSTFTRDFMEERGLSPVHPNFPSGVF